MKLINYKFILPHIAIIFSLPLPTPQKRKEKTNKQTKKQSTWDSNIIYSEIVQNIPKGSKFVHHHTDAKLNWHSYYTSIMQLVPDSFSFFWPETCWKFYLRLNTGKILEKILSRETKKLF